MLSFRKTICQKNGKPAYTLLELLIAFSILVIISVMIAVPVVNGLGSKKLSTQVVETMTDIIKAYSAYLRDNGAVVLGQTKGVEILDYINYQRIDTSTAFDVPSGAGIPDGLADTNVNTSTCSATLRCLVLQNGGLLQVNKNAVFPDLTGTGKIFSGLVMNYDPDGSGDQPATTLVLFSNGRVTSAPFVDDSMTLTDTTNVITNTAPFGNANSDPEYMYGFTNDSVVN